MKVKVKKDIVQLLKTLLLCIGVGYLLLVVVYCLPIEPIQNHVRESQSVLEQEGIAPVLVEGYINTRLDNYSDGLMLNTAICEEGTNPFEKAAANYNYLYPDNDTYYLGSTFQYLDGDEQYTVDNRARYWHGYLVVLKPLLSVMNLQVLRIINFAMQLLLLGLVMARMIQKNMKKYIPALLIAAFFLTPMVLYRTMMYSVIYYVTFGMTLFLLCHYDKIKKNDAFVVYFAVAGAATSYFDLLSYPLLTLCIPFTFFYLLKRSESNSIGNDIFEFIELGISWLVGYVGMWAGKWVIATVLTENNIVKEAILQVLYRASSAADDSGEHVEFTLIDVLAANFGVYKHWIYFAILLVLTLFGICMHRRSGCTWHVNHKIIFLGLIFMIPVAWYVVIGNYSYIHYWMAHRMIAGMVFTYGCILVGDCENGKK